MAHYESEIRTIRYDKVGKLTILCHSGGYLMVRRPKAIPFVMREKDWRKLAIEQQTTDSTASKEGE